MKVYPLLLIALALIAGTAGYVTQRMMNSDQSVAVTSATKSAPVSNNPATGTRDSAPATPSDWSFADLDGDAQPLSQWQGKVTVLNFWATWCPPCLREIPAFIELQTKYGTSGLQFVGIALDKPEVVGPFVADKAINYPIVVGDQQVVKFMQTLGNEIGGLPYTAVIDEHGAVLYTHQGEWEHAEAEAYLSALLDTP